MSGPVLSVRGLRFAWPGSSADCPDIESFDVAPGETVFAHGPSGWGKSSLLALLAGVPLPQHGQVYRLSLTDGLSPRI